MSEATQAHENGSDVSGAVVTFDQVFRAELNQIRERHNGDGRQSIPDDTTHLKPTTTLELTGLALSGGGIRSASFCLGVLQGLQSKDVIRHMDYMSTVSGGGYIGITTTIGMSSNGGTFPFGRLGQENRETPELRHLRDHSRYLLQNGIPGVVSAAVIYLRGIAMNVVVLLPILLIGAALLVWLNPDTKELTTNRLGSGPLGLFEDTRIPFTLSAGCVVAALLVLYAVVVSILGIQPLKSRQRAAWIAGSIFFFAFVISLIELHTLLLRLIFEAQGYIQPSSQLPTSGGAQVFEILYQWAKTFVITVTPLVVAILPFLKKLGEKASEGGGAGMNGDIVKRIASRALLLIAAPAVPLLLWLAMMQFAYWGTAISTCPENDHILICARSATGDAAWPHAPLLLQRLFREPRIFPGTGPWAVYGVGAAILIALWPFLSVNANSLHQLYRDRLGRAFLIRRDPNDPAQENVDPVDDFLLTQIAPQHAPYHIINAALNVPGSKFANRRGRDADFFLFSRAYVGSEVTHYVDTNSAEKVVDGLNIGTAMAISGAAVAPNMGMASVRPLSPTIAFLNVRLGRWVRHPREIARRMKIIEKNKPKRKASSMGWGLRVNGGEWQLQRIPGPVYLLFEAFSKSGLRVTNDNVEKKNRGFVFLTDGGHIDNLGIYELLRRRCRLIIAVDGEADPDLDAASLMQVERFARIDLNVTIRMNWKPIGLRTRAVANEIRGHTLKAESGPHVAVGLINYPPAATGSGREREKGVLIYIKASLSGDENDYVSAYKAAHQLFPHESTGDQLFSEEQFEVYRALGEHIAQRFVDGRDEVAALPEDRAELLEIIRAMMPHTAPR